MHELTQEASAKNTLKILSVTWQCPKCGELMVHSAFVVAFQNADLKCTTCKFISGAARFDDVEPILIGTEKHAKYVGEAAAGKTLFGRPVVMVPSLGDESHLGNSPAFNGATGTPADGRAGRQSPQPPGSGQ